MKTRIASAVLFVALLLTANQVLAESRAHSDIALAHSSDTYRVMFAGGERVSIRVSGDGSSDLDLYVYDENGNQIGADDDYTDECFVSFTPRWTGMFTIRVVNRGRNANRYVISTLQ